MILPSRISLILCLLHRLRETSCSPQLPVPSSAFGVGYGRLSRELWSTHGSTMLVACSVASSLFSVSVLLQIVCLRLRNVLVPMFLVLGLCLLMESSQLCRRLLVPISLGVPCVMLDHNILLFCSTMLIHGRHLDLSSP